MTGLVLCSVALALVALRARRDGWRAWVSWARGGPGDAVLVLGGLATQGLIVPAIRVAWATFLGAHLGGAVAAGPWLGLFLVLVVTDGLWWLQHRWLHGHGWPLHAVHHEARRMDVWCTSRGTWWVSLGFVYLWVDALWLALLVDDRGVLWGMTMHAALDLWRHSGLDLPGPLHQALGGWIIRPCDHQRHHDASAEAVNLGANWAVWDVWAGTFRAGDDASNRIGAPTGLAPWQAAVWPWGTR
ncbi:MAG: hypothetical protein RLZZ383_2783 [Pseudomonadota bacterium]